jgi:hypothetical protein
MENEPEQEGLFTIAGPDQRGRVWIESTSSRDWWTHNLGPHEKAIEVVSRWLASVGVHERHDPHTASPEVDADEADKRLAKRARKIARPGDHREEGGQG